MQYLAKLFSASNSLAHVSRPTGQPQSDLSFRSFYLSVNALVKVGDKIF